MLRVISPAIFQHFQKIFSWYLIFYLEQAISYALLLVLFVLPKVHFLILQVLYQK